jgi:hypothetical protein
LAAACIALMLWLGIGGASVTAATIFGSLKAAVADSLTIRLEGIDLETVDVHGEIILDRAEPGAADDARYAEVHVLMKADNPEWDDLDAVLVISETPTESWQFCRGNGGSCCEEDRAVTPTEYFMDGHGWEDFAARPLDDFSAMPLALGFGQGDSTVNYRFSVPQRDLVDELLRLLLEMSDPATSDATIDDLQRWATETGIERIDERTYRLYASKFERLGEWELSQPRLDEAGVLLKDVVWELRFDKADRRFIGWILGSTPAGWDELNAAIKVKAAERQLPFESFDALIAHLGSVAEDVVVDDSGDDELIVRVTGYPFDVVVPSGVKWQRGFMQTLFESLTLSILYDAEAGRVLDAEFRGIGPADGRVVLEIGAADVPAERSKPDYWLTPRTEFWGDEDGMDAPNDN